MNERAKKIFPFSILSRSPKRIEVKPTVPIPKVSVAWKTRQVKNGIMIVQVIFRTVALNIGPTS